VGPATTLPQKMQQASLAHAHPRPGE